MEETLKYVLTTNFWISILIFASYVIIWNWLRRLINKQIKKHNISGKKENNIRLTLMFTRIILFLIIVMQILQINGINVSSLVTGFGVAGIIIGFALQDLLKDIMMGSNIIWDNFFKIGDVVKYHGTEGVIHYFNIKVTKIYDIYTGNIMTVSNRNISEIELVSDWLDVIIPAGYDEDIDKMRKVMKTICNKINESPEISSCDFLGTDSFESSYINYRIRLHVSPDLKPIAKRKALGIIQDIYKQEDIHFPYPKQELSIKNKS